MAISMRQLFTRRAIGGEVISLRNSLENHHNGLRMGLREADSAFTTLNRNSGFDSGCRQPDELQIGIDSTGATVLGGLLLGPIGAIIGAASGGVGFDIGGVLPSWVPVDFRDHRETPRIIEGVLLKSKITRADFPLRPWHTFYDWNFFVHVDPQYRYLLNELTREDHSKSIFGGESGRTEDIMECEWDTAFLPLRAIPQVGSRVWMLGRWIFDCGHPKNGHHRMELHPLRAIASFGSEPATFEGNGGPTQANHAVFFAGRRGGYIEHPINDRDCAFDIYLPPKPHPAAEPRVAVGRIASSDDSLSARPRVDFAPERNPRLGRVVIPLTRLAADPRSYDAVISVGWSDPEGTEVRKVKGYRVTVTRVAKVANTKAANVLWVFYVGVNGRWETVELGKLVNDLNISFEFNLHEDDSIHITACGFARLAISHFMGKESGIAPELVSRSLTDKQRNDAAKDVESAFKRHIDRDHIPGSTSNIPLSLFSQTHRPVQFQAFNEDSADHLGPSEKDSNENRYVLSYRIEELSATV